MAKQVSGPRVTDKDCIFCKIIAGEIETQKVWEDEDFIVFADLYPTAPVHVLIVPKEHIPTAADVTKNQEQLMGRVFTLAKTVADKLSIADGYQLHVNVGKKAGQVVFHLHVHLTGGWKTIQN